MIVLTVLRSTIYSLLQIVITPLYFLIILAAFPLPPHEPLSHHVGLGASDAVSAPGYLRHPLSYQRREHIPAVPSIILSKHQSAWETLAFQQIFPPRSGY